MSSLRSIEGIAESYEIKLKQAGVSSVEELLEKGAKKGGREELAKATGIAEKLILRWTNHADLFRIKGVGGQYAELLEAAGIDTVPELSQRKPEHLMAKLTEVNAEKKLVRQLPTEAHVANWIAEARKLPKKMTY